MPTVHPAAGCKDRPLVCPRRSGDGGEAEHGSPTLIVAASQVGDGITPVPVDTSAIPNNHWGYAIQWFLLAATWAGMTVYLLWRIKRGQLEGDAMKYISTRGAAPVLGFGEAMMTGLARDGGLYVPETVPALSRPRSRRWRGCPMRKSPSG
jgi:hypothetical protein